MKYKNYHTHTFRCQHATGDVIDYAKEAVQNHVTVLGMSDHAALPDDRWSTVRMRFEELDEYEKAIHDAQQQVPQLLILKGMECEYLPEFHAYFQDELLGERQYDYLIGAAHYTPVDGTWLSSFEELNTPQAFLAYSRYMIRMMESQLFTFIAHPDVFGICNSDWNQEMTACTRDIAQVAKETNTILEINGSGFRKGVKRDSSGKQRVPYPWLPFWEIIAEYEITAICNSDAHDPQKVIANIDDGLQLAHSLQIPLADLSYLEEKSASSSDLNELGKINPLRNEFV